MVRVVRSFCLFLACLVAVASHADNRDDPASERFYGHYKGHADLVASLRKGGRDLSVQVSPIDVGFKLVWSTTTTKSDGREKLKRYEVEFVRDTRPNLYQLKSYHADVDAESAQAEAQYRPHAWAHIKDDTMTVQVLLISDDGGYEMQTYVRQLTVGGMDLTFVRVRDGVPYRVIEGRLTRTASLSQSE